MNARIHTAAALVVAALATSGAGAHRAAAGDTDPTRWLSAYETGIAQLHGAPDAALEAFRRRWLGHHAGDLLAPPAPPGALDEDGRSALEEARVLLAAPPRASTAEADLAVPFAQAASKSSAADDAQKLARRFRLRLGSPYGADAEDAEEEQVSKKNRSRRRVPAYDAWDSLSLEYAVPWPLGLLLTRDGIREANRFNYFAIIEVAVIFIGIFITMQVPLEVLKLKGAELGLTEPWHYFWATGILSSFLDNAPTYLVFFQTAESLSQEPGDGILTLMGGAFIRHDLLVAISLGAVFMGANTYIGNGPNFMVKAIAEQEGVRMPSFFGYMAYSCLILLPLFVLVTLIFLI